MSFVAYRISDTVILRKRFGESSFETERAAKAAITRAVRKGLIKKEDYAVALAEKFYAEIEQTRTVKNLMSGEDVEVTANTPACCDPSSETYWCM